MAFFISAGVVAFVGLILLIIGAALEKQSAYFEKNKRCGQAEVVGHQCSSQSNYSTLLVRIPDLRDDNAYNCASGKIDISCFPKGTMVNVWYASKRVAGMNVVEVYLYDNPPADSTKTAWGIKKVSISMFAIVGILTVAGLMTLL